MRGKINKLLILCLITGLNIQASEVITAKATILGNEESVGLKDDPEGYHLDILKRDQPKYSGHGSSERIK